MEDLNTEVRWKVEFKNNWMKDLPNSFVVQREKLMYRSRKGELSESMDACGEFKECTRQFAIFNYLAFEQYYLSQPEPKSFYEYVRAEYPQKPYLDIDIGIDNYLKRHGYSNPKQFKNDFDKLPEADKVLWYNILEKEAQAVMNEAITAIEKEMQFQEIDYHRDRNLIVLSSNKDTKKSYHIIINGLCFNDNLENKTFYHNVSQRMGSLSYYVDESVYNNFRAFRMIGSTKLGQNRPLILDTNYTTCNPVQDEQYRDIYLLRSTIITWYEDSKIIDKRLKKLEETMSVVAGDGSIIKVPKPAAQIQKSFRSVQYDMNLDLMKTLEMLFYQTYLPKYFKIAGYPSNTGLVKLTRTAPMQCPICNRVHENENAFIVYSGKQFLFRCLRNNSNNSGVILTTLKSK